MVALLKKCYPKTRFFSAKCLEFGTKTFRVYTSPKCLTRPERFNYSNHYIDIYHHC